MSCLLEKVSEFINCRIYILPCFEFPYTIDLVAYFRFLTVPISARVMEAGCWSFGHECSAEGGYDRGTV